MSSRVAFVAADRICTAARRGAISVAPFIVACVVAATAGPSLARAAAGSACVLALCGLVVTRPLRLANLAERLLAALVASFVLDALALIELLALSASLRGPAFLAALAATTCVAGLALEIARPPGDDTRAWRGELVLQAATLVVATLACLTVGS